jgi:hypothetical protein
MSYFFEHIGTIPGKTGVYYPVIEMRHIGIGCYGFPAIELSVSNCPIDIECERTGDTFGGVTGNCEANCDEEQSYCDAATRYLSLENCYKLREMLNRAIELMERK